MVRYSFLVRLFHPPLHAGLSRRTNIPITLKMPGTGILSVMAFHEKAGRSQGILFFILSDKLFLTFSFGPAEWPLSPCFHPHSRGAIRFARCMLGVLNSAGAAICLATYRSTQSGTWPRPLTQSPELGFRLFPSWNDFDFGLAVLFLRGCRNCHSVAVVQWLVHLSAHP